MALLNVRSLLNKSFIINDLILHNKLDCLFLTETGWARMHQLFSLRPPHQILISLFPLEVVREVVGLHL